MFRLRPVRPLSIRPAHGSCWARRKHPDRLPATYGVPIYVILDNLSANKTPATRAWVARRKVTLCFTPTSASWANPIEARSERQQRWGCP